jgi:integrase
VRQTFIPYVYTRAELRALLAAAPEIEKSSSSINSQTFRAFLLLLYGTGSSLGEMLALRYDDVDLKRYSLQFEAGIRDGLASFPSVKTCWSHWQDTSGGGIGADLRVITSSGQRQAMLWLSVRSLIAFDGSARPRVSSGAIQLPNSLGCMTLGSRSQFTESRLGFETAPI